MSQILDKTPPSALALSISSLLLGLVAGYFIGSGSSLGLFSSQSKHTPTGQKGSWPNSYDVKVHADSSDEEAMADDEQEESEDEDAGDGRELSNFEGNNEEVKLVLVVRTDLGMGKGKIAAQCGHATLSCYKYLLSHPGSSSILKRWEDNGQPKIAAQGKTEEELQTLEAMAVSLGLCARTIHDAGRTQIAAGSMTVLGVLGPKSVVDQVTGGLKLL